MSGPSLRHWLAGALTPPVMGCALAGATALHWPDLEGLTTPARILDSLAPHLLALALAGTVALTLLRAWRSALLALLVVLAGGGGLLQRHLAQSAPLATGQAADLTVLWFNMLGSNPTPPERLAAALAASPADIVILGEAAPLAGDPGLLAAAFPHRAGCRPSARRCDILVLSRIPLEVLDVLRIGRAREERLARMTATLPGRAPLTVLAIHMAKPWFFGFIEADDWYAETTLAAATETGGPVLMTGDFNAAPWSRRMQGLAACCGATFPRLPPATWPAAAGAFGVPIDHMLTAGDARLVSLAPWGAGLGSNHRGLLAGIALPPAE